LGLLKEMRTRPIMALLQTLETAPELEPAVQTVLSACPYAGNHLADILAERKFSLVLRGHAARMIGQVGYLCALPVLERLAHRLEVRLNGQQSMDFTVPDRLDETSLLPAVQRTIQVLSEP
jgi:hypothetical protein